MEDNDVTPLRILPTVRQTVHDHKLTFVQRRLHADAFDANSGGEKIDRQEKQTSDEDSLEYFTKRTQHSREEARWSGGAHL
jgi:hypothetical protein